MMHKLRENTKVILWIVVVSFVVTIFAVWGLDLQTGGSSGDPNVIGKVNGIPITRSQYQFVYEQFAQQIRSSSPDRSLTYAQQEFISNQAWDNIVYGILTTQEIERLGITVTDDEIVSFLRNTPPAEVQPYFVDENGNFDNQAYQTALNNPEIDWTQLEALARERIPRAKLNEYLSAQVHVSEDEIRNSYESEATKLRISYVQFPFEEADLSDYTPNDDEVKTYYDEHQSDFLDPEKARIEVIRIPIETSVADVGDAAFAANKLHGDIVGGEDFAYVAKTYSEASTANVDGQTGFITRGSRDDAYFDALDALDDGELAEPISTAEGYYIVKLIEKRKGDGDTTEYNAQEVLIKAVVSRQTTDSLYALADTVVRRAPDVGFAEAAEEMRLTVVSPEPFFQDGPIGTFGFVAAVNRFAFSNDAGKVSDVLRDENNIYVARLAERIPESVRPLDEVSEPIRTQLIQEKKKDVAYISAKAFFQKARSSDLETAVETYGVEIQHPDSFRAVDNLDNFGPRSSIAEAALAVTPGELVPPVQSRQSYVVFKVHDRTPIDPAAYKARIPAIRDQLLNQKIQQYVSFWIERLKEKGDIEDYRT